MDRYFADLRRGARGQVLWEHFKISGEWLAFVQFNFDRELRAITSRYAENDADTKTWVTKILDVFKQDESEILAAFLFLKEFARAFKADDLVQLTEREARALYWIGLAVGGE